jgi:septal ring factor EnvC (AmiA/AmiB activator)
MANIRQLKKAIDSQIYEVISDCFTWNELNPDKKSDVVDNIISDAVNFRNELIQRINNPDRSADPKRIKAYYQLISKDLSSGVDSLCSRLSSVSMKKKK